MPRTWRLAFARGAFWHRVAPVFDREDAMDRVELTEECIRAFVEGDHERSVACGLSLLEGGAPHEVVQAVLIGLDRLGRREVLEDLGAQAVALSEPHPHFRALVELTLGRVAPRSVIESAEGPDRRSQALFYAAQRRLTEGDGAGARGDLIACVEIESDCSERVLAAAMLERLDGEAVSDEEAAVAQRNTEALAHYHAGDLAAAARAWAGAIESAGATIGAGHPLTATLLNNLAMAYLGLGEPAEGLALAERAREIRRQALGERHPQYAESLNNLAEFRRASGDMEGAIGLANEALELRRAILGTGHPDFAASLVNLGALRLHAGEPERAIALFEQARDLQGAALGPASPARVLSLANLANAFRSVGRPGEAVPLLREVARIDRESYGEAHPAFAQAITEEAAALHEAGESSEARGLLERARDIWRGAVGEEHAGYRQAVRNLEVVSSAIAG